MHRAGQPFMKTVSWSRGKWYSVASSQAQPRPDCIAREDHELRRMTAIVLCNGFGCLCPPVAAHPACPPACTMCAGTGWFALHGATQSAMFASSLLGFSATFASMRQWKRLVCLLKSSQLMAIRLVWFGEMNFSMFVFESNRQWDEK